MSDRAINMTIVILSAFSIVCSAIGFAGAYMNGNTLGMTVSGLTVLAFGIAVALRVYMMRDRG